MTSAERMQGYLLSQFKGKEIVIDLLEVIGEEFDFHEKLKNDIATLIWPDVASGHQLDLCGEVADIGRTIEGSIPLEFFGFPRHGDKTFGQARFKRYLEPYTASSTLYDADYRLAVKAKIMKNNTNCTRNSIIKDVKNILNVTDVTIENLGNASVAIGVRKNLTNKDVTLIKKMNLIPLPAGVTVYLWWYDTETAPPFVPGGSNVWTL